MGMIKRTLIFLSIIAVLIALSFHTSRLWGGKSEKIPKISNHFEYSTGITIREFAKRNRLPESIVQNVFNIKNEQELDWQIELFGLSRSELLKKTNRTPATHA
ncbi:MAG: hypothetical protein A2176_15215 [Spirochaetes bacterium RBG_13_51_14]|nr:MAG: hypothetical protein A2176_15215 [Spirochaetes bacterium RBG_13_51_14]